MTTEAQYRALLEQAAKTIDWLTKDKIFTVNVAGELGALTGSIRATLAAQPKPLFEDLIAQHEGLADELAAMDTQPSESSPTHPQFVAGYKAGAYAANRRLELNPHKAVKVDIGQTKCPECDHNFVAFLPAQPSGPDWHDAPTAPGLWLNSVFMKVEDVEQWHIDCQLHLECARWFGPIPPDGDKP